MSTPIRTATLALLVLGPMVVVGQPNASVMTPFASDSALVDYLKDLSDRERKRAEEERERRRQDCTSPSDSVAVLSGRLTDAETGEPLIGGNVFLPAVERGAATDINGDYSIIGIPAGVYDVHYSYAGYEPQTLSKVELCNRHPSPVDVALVSGGVGEVVVAYERPFGVTGQSITNNQVDGVDEGGIVKLMGDHLVILRRGRLFTVDIGGGVLVSVDAADLSPPGLDPQAAWYDELLIVGRTAIVIGYSYARFGTEVILFDVGVDGHLTYRSTYHLRSNDYYSWQGYAGRVVEGRLVFYTPLVLGRRTLTHQNEKVEDQLPALRLWSGDADGAFVPVASATDVFRPARDLIGIDLALHTITSCAVSDGALDCQATVAIGPRSREFYVSRSAVYAWGSGRYSRRGRGRPVLYRLPLDGSPPSAVGVTGSPINPFSFHEASDALLVAVSEWPETRWTWNSERPAQKLSLLRIPHSAFGDGSDEAPPSWYRTLPAPAAINVNRFVGDHLLYGSSYASDYRLLGVRWDDPSTVSTLPMGHTVERVEQMGESAVVVGENGSDLHFTPVRLGGRLRSERSHRLRGMAQSESRSHGFFYRPTGDEHGMLGLPVRHWGAHREWLNEGSASVVYLQNEGLDLRRLGTLDADSEPVDDACIASCVDWYGNARPLFLGDRVFALMGYEIVEGRIETGQIREVERTSFAPAHVQTTR